MSFGSPPINTSPIVGPGKATKRGIGTGVISAVDNAQSPTYCTVLVNNSFPPESGYTIPQGFGPFAAGGTAGFSYFYNNSNGIGGSIVTVDLDNKRVLSFTGAVSKTAPSPKYNNLVNHYHIGNLNPTTGTVVGPVNTNGTGLYYGNFPYLATAGTPLTPARDTGNILTSLGLTGGVQPNNTLYDSTVIVIPRGGAVITNWNSKYSGIGNWGPAITDGTTTYAAYLNDSSTGSLRLDGSALATIATQIEPNTVYQFTFIAINMGGTTWRFVLYSNENVICDYTDGDSPLGTRCTLGFYSDTANAVTHYAYGYWGTTENAELLENPSYSTAPAVASASSIVYPQVSSAPWAHVNVTLTKPTPPQWATGLALYTSSSNNLTSAAGITPINVMPLSSDGIYNATFPLVNESIYYLYVGWIDLTLQPGTPTLLSSSPTSGSPTLSTITGSMPSNAAPVLAYIPDGISYTENLADSNYDALINFKLATADSSLSWLAGYEYVYTPSPVTGSSVWTAAGVGSNNALSNDSTQSGLASHVGIWSALTPGTQLALGVRYVDSAGNRSLVTYLGTTLADPAVVPVYSPAPATPPVPVFATGSTSVEAFGTGSLPGVLDDFQVTTTVTNIPQDGTVSRFLWAIRKSTDPLVADPGAAVTLVQTASNHTSGDLPLENAPSVGNLVVLIVNGGAYSFASGWSTVQPVGGAISTGVAYKYWTSSDTVGESVLTYHGTGINDVCMVAYEFSGINQTLPLYLNTNIVTQASDTIEVDPVIPQEQGEFYIAFGSAANYTTTISDTTVSNDWIMDNKVSTGYGTPDTIVSAHYYSLTTDTVAGIGATFTVDGSIPNGAQWETGIIAIRSYSPQGTSGGTVYPWTYYDEQDIDGFPYPAVEQVIENGFGQVVMGVQYDFAGAFVTTDGVIGPLGIMLENYTSPNTLNIPGQYLIGNVAYSPNVSPGIPAEQTPTVPMTDGVPPYDTAQEAIVQTINPNGLTAAYLVSFQIKNQPVDGSLARVCVYYRVTVSSGTPNPWGYFSSEPAVGLGLPKSQLPTVGNYQLNLMDISVGATQSFDIGIACRAVNDDETSIEYLGTTVPVDLAPSELANGALNLVVDSSFQASKYTQGTSAGFAHTQVSKSNPYWYFHGIDGTNSALAQGGDPTTTMGNCMLQDTQADGSRFYAISYPIPVQPSQTLTVSAQIQALGCGAGARVCIVDSTGTATYNTIYATASQGSNNGRVSTTWTVPADGSVTTVAVMLDNNGQAASSGHYLYMGKPMLQTGPLTAYVVGPSAPPTGSTTTSSIAVVPTDNTGSGNADDAVPTITSSNAAPVSGSSATATDQQPQGSLRFTASGVYVQNGATATSPSWISIGSSNGNSIFTIASSFPASPAIGEAVYRTDLAASYVYLNSTAGWVLLGPDTLAGLDDVSVAGLATGQVLTWNGSKWVNETPASPGSTTLAGDSDVAITSPVDGQVLVYNGVAGKWENEVPALPSAIVVGGLYTEDGTDLIIEENGTPFSLENLPATATIGNAYLDPSTGYLSIYCGTTLGWVSVASS